MFMDVMQVQKCFFLSSVTDVQLTLSPTFGKQARVLFGKGRVHVVGIETTRQNMSPGHPPD